MTGRPSLVFCAVALGLFLPAAAAILPFHVSTVPQKVLPSLSADSGSGISLALSGDTLVLGASHPDGDGLGAEVAFVYARDALGLWSLAATLAGDAPGSFGWSVALDDDVLVVGAPTTQVANAFLAGVAYVFELGAGDEWLRAATLVASDAAALDAFGTTVAVSGDVIAVGAPGSGAAYVFERAGAAWLQTARLGLPGGGWAVALDEGRVAVAGTRVVRTYERIGNGWAVAGSVHPEDAPATFIKALAIEDDTLVVGAHGEPTPSTLLGSTIPSGAAYVFHRSSDGEWVKEATLGPADASPLGWTDRFGWALDLHAGRLVIGAPSDDRSPAPPSSPVKAALPCNSAAGAHACQDHGAAYVYERSMTGAWALVTKLSAPDGTQGDAFGHAVSLSDGHVVAGAPLDDVTTGLDEAFPGRDVGAAYVFTLPDGGI